MTVKKRASRGSLKSDLARSDAHVVSAKEYKEVPELTAEMIARGSIRNGRRQNGRRQKGRRQKGASA